MPRISVNEPAPHFCLLTYHREPVSLIDFLGRKHALIVFNRGFT
jgi:peroxiredoxin